jgi:UDP-N-acetylmuramate--alanine ligase
MKIKVGIFFGGSSREREISFAGGRTVYDNLDKTIFDAIPIFVDSDHDLIVLDWQYIYKGTIRDFYPPVEFHPNSAHSFQIYLESLGNVDYDKKNEIINKVGKKISIEDLKNKIDFAFLALHGAFAEDGTIQGLLEFNGIPYSGSGISPSAIGINKALQKKLMNLAAFQATLFTTVSKQDWKRGENIYEKTKLEVGFPCVIRPANQGSSIGVSILQTDDKKAFDNAVQKAFFTLIFETSIWRKYSEVEKKDYINQLIDIRESLGLPLRINEKIFIHPEELFAYFDSLKNEETILLEAIDTEAEIIIEEFIEGKEFSCIVLQDENGTPIALPPTEIVKGKELFDYRSKYLAGLSRKITPIQLDDEDIQSIRSECERLFKLFEFNVYARIDGFFKKDKTIILNDPNTTSGMLPSSFFFHQAAEIGLNPSQFLTYIIHTSLKERIRTTSKSYRYEKILNSLEESLELKKSSVSNKIKVAVMLGGYSSERHISVESGRNIYEKLASSSKYEPIPVFVMGDDHQHELYSIPINILLKDNADDIKDKILKFKTHPIIELIKKECISITDKFSNSNYQFVPQKISYQELASMVDAVFIALHGRPGEDGTVQKELDKIGLAYNGSTPDSSILTINKYNTNQLLIKNGFVISKQTLGNKNDWKADKEKFYNSILSNHSLPIIAKPVDDGCSSAVKKIKTKEELVAFVELMFRDTEDLDSKFANTLHLKLKEEFPNKKEILFEDLTTSNGAYHFLEITGGLLTHFDKEGKIYYEMFEPSETLAVGEVLSLEEKFLAGEGLNITPARFSKNKVQYEKIMLQVKKDLEAAARALKVTGYCRIDAFVRIFENGKVETIVIEVNSLPGMTPATCIFHQAALHNYKPYDFIDKILEFSFSKKSQKVS